MTGSFDIDTPNSKIAIRKDGRTVFDTTTRPPQLIPAAKINLTSYDIEFPDLWKGVYYRQGVTTGPVGNIYRCLTCAAVVNQEWGPELVSPHNLPEITLGSIPAQCNYIEVMARFNRVVNPSQMRGRDISSFMPLNQWIKLDGGSQMVEWDGPLRRMFDIRISGTSVLLRRRQSMTINKDGVTTLSRTHSTSAAQPGNVVYYFDGPNAPYPINAAPSPDPNVYPNPAMTIGAVLDYKGPDGGANHRPGRFGGQDGCSEDMSGVSYRSVYRTDLVITPGIV